MSTRRALSVMPALLLSVAVQAAPIQVGSDAFGPGTVLFVFPDSGSTPPAGLSLASPNQLDFGPPGMWDPSDPAFNSLAFDTLELRLDVPAQAVGFYFGSNWTSEVTVSVGRQGGASAEFTLAVAGDLLPADGVSNWVFYGFSDPDGIDTLVFGANQAQGGFLVGIGNLRAYAPTAVPEPASLALLGAGLVGLGLARRRRRRIG